MDDQGSVLGKARRPGRPYPSVPSPGVKRPGREADHSPPPTADVKNAWSYTSTPKHVCMAWYLITRNVFWLFTCTVTTHRTKRSEGRLCRISDTTWQRSSSGDIKKTFDDVIMIRRTASWEQSGSYRSHGLTHTHTHTHTHTEREGHVLIHRSTGLFMFDDILSTAQIRLKTSNTGMDSSTCIQ
jgi:hypothetical protein